MCGIVGFITGAKNGFTQDEMNAFKDMLVVDALRGMDSTGVFSVSNKGNVEILKAAMNASSFIGSREYTSFANGAYTGGKILVGHNRAATRGSITDANAHPFTVDDKIVLVQNGTYRGCHKHHKNVEVDTHAIAHVIAENEKVEDALKKINAAYALVWYNTENMGLHIIRNSERPMYFSETTTGGRMFASEPEFILMAASRNNIKLANQPYMLKEEELIVHTIDKKGGWDQESFSLDCKFQGRFYPVYGQGTVFYPGQQRSASDDWYNRYPGSPVNDVQRLPAPQQTGVDVTSNVTQTLYHYLYQDKFQEFELTKKQADVVNDDLEQRPGRKLTVEIIDYLPANNSSACKSWYIYGSVINTIETTPSPMVYQLIVNKTEIEVMELVAKQFFTAERGTAITHHMKNSGNYIITINTTNMKALPEVTDIIERVSQTH